MDVKVREITPTQAATWLERNTTNRNINGTHVTRLKNSMIDGSWEENGDAIRFSKGGRLLDGQHRLSACVLANVPFKSLVITGLEDSVFSTIDAGKSRSFSDTLKVNGETLTGALATSVTYLEAYEKGSITLKTSSVCWQMGTSSTRLQTLNSHPGIRDVVDAVYSKMPKALRKPAIAVAIYLAGLNNPTKAQDLFKKLQTGANLGDTDPILILRNKLLSIKQEKASIMVKASFLFAITVKAINAEFSGYEVKQFRMGASEMFPTLLNFTYGRKVDASAALAKTKRGLNLAA